MFTNVINKTNKIIFKIEIIMGRHAKRNYLENLYDQFYFEQQKIVVFVRSLIVDSVCKH